jgi:hypothetical protein
MSKANVFVARAHFTERRFVKIVSICGALRRTCACASDNLLQVVAFMKRKKIQELDALAAVFGARSASATRPTC